MLKGSGNYNCHPLKISLNNGEGQNNNTVVSLPLNHRLADSAHDERGDRRRNTAARPKKPAERPKARGRRKEIRSQGSFSQTYIRWSVAQNRPCSLNYKSFDVGCLFHSPLRCPFTNRIITRKFQRRDYIMVNLHIIIYHVRLLSLHIIRCQCNVLTML